MPRPKFAPGSTLVLPVRNRAGKKPLAQYLASRLGVVDAWARDLADSGRVTLDGRTADGETLINLSAGPHEIVVVFPEAWPRHMAATAMPLDILREDDALLVLDKPPGIVVHPARGHLDNQTLQNGVRHRYRHLLGRDGVTIGAPHRLDRDTSGALAFAVTTEAYIELVRQFAAAEVEKTYFAILDGDPGFETMVVDRPIGPDPAHRGRGKALPESEGGKSARTEFLIVERGKGWALACVRPRTGRPHQIRVHAADLGLPLAGDREYNGDPGRLGMARQALHAGALSFSHPVTGERIRVEAPLPADMRGALERLRKKAKQ